MKRPAGFHPFARHATPRQLLRRLGLAACVALLAACAGPSGMADGSDGRARAAVPPSSPECLASKIKPVDPFPASALPADLLAKARTGLVALRYDVIDGLPKNIDVVSSTPPGFYDDAARRYLATYRDPKGGTARGCVMTVDIKF